MGSIKKHINKNRSIKIVLPLIILFTVTFISAHAQGPVDPGTDPDNAPVDGGISLLVAGGLGYGIKKMREQRLNK